MDLTPAQINEYVATAFPSVANTGFRCAALGQGWAEAHWTHDPDGLRPGDYIPGPTIFGLADLALWFAVFTEIGVEGMAVTTDMTIHFLRPAVGGDLVARAELTKVGRRLAHGKVDVWVDGDAERLVAFCSGAYALPG